MTDWLFDDVPNVAVLTTRSVIHDGAWIANVFRGASDGGWQFHDGGTHTPREKDARVVSLHSMVLRDDTLTELADLPEGWQAWREAPTAPWRRSRTGWRGTIARLRQRSAALRRRM